MLRRFQLVRDRDLTGVSGEGVVAEGVQWRDGRVHWQWLRWPFNFGEAASVTALLAAHGHDGATRIEWLDKEQTDAGHSDRTVG